MNNAARDLIEDSRQWAVSASVLADLPFAIREQVVGDALPVELPGGSVIYRDEDDPRCILIIDGLVRVFLSVPDGRTVTVRYARSSELLGVPVVVGGPAPVSVQMVIDTTLLMLNARTLRLLGQTEPSVGWLLAREATRRLYDTLDAVADNAFGSLRQRVARHLLDLRLVAAVTQQDLAEAVGSARPAVARAVGELRELGLVTTASPGIAILDAEGVHAQTWSQTLSQT
jgi:CRP/FNR family transcriptional regulator, cyclic AMP receptor protein